MTDYPFPAWVLNAKFVPREVTLVKRGPTEDWHEDARGVWHHVDLVSPSKSLAIAKGRIRLVAQQAALNKKQIAIDARAAMLTKYEEKE